MALSETQMEGVPEYFRAYVKECQAGLVPSKCAKNREKYSDGTLVIVGCDSAEAVFEENLTHTLQIICGNLIKANNGRGATKVSWIEASRTTSITPDQLDQLGVKLTCSHIIAIQLCMRAKLDDDAQKVVDQLHQDCDELKKAYPDRVWFTHEKSTAQSKA